MGAKSFRAPERTLSPLLSIGLFNTEGKKPQLSKIRRSDQHLYLHSRTWSWRSPSHSPCGRTGDWCGGWRTSRRLCSWWSSAWPARGMTTTCNTACRCIESRRSVMDNTFDIRLFLCVCLVVRVVPRHIWNCFRDSCLATWAKWTNELFGKDSFRFY